MKQERRFIVDILFVLTLFVIFAISALTLVTVGASVYKRTVDSMSNNYDARTSCSYISEKIRQNDFTLSTGESGVAIASLAQKPALLLVQEINGQRYHTYLYFHDGYLKELFIRDGSFIGDDLMDAGQKIVTITDFSIEWIDDRLLSITLVTQEDNPKQLFIHLNSKKGTE